MAVPTRPEASVCSWLKNSKQSFAPTRQVETRLALSDLARDFVHPIARASIGHANRDAEQAKHCQALLAVCRGPTFDHASCPILCL
jgi:hypothetical protein